MTDQAKVYLLRLLDSEWRYNVDAYVRSNDFDTNNKCHLCGKALIHQPTVANDVQPDTKDNLDSSNNCRVCGTSVPIVPIAS